MVRDDLNSILGVANLRMDSAVVWGSMIVNRFRRKVRMVGGNLLYQTKDV